MFQALSQSKRRRQEYVREVRKLRKQIFKLTDAQILEHNHLWEEWLHLGDRKERDLSVLLKAPVHDAFKARVLAILLAPGSEFFPSLPSDWFDRLQRPHALKYWEMDLARMSQPLQDFSLGVLEINQRYGLANIQQPHGLTQHAVNTFALAQLAERPEGDQLAERWFAQYRFFVTYGSQYDCYRPYELLLHAVVPKKWKWRASEQMQQMIIARMEGKTTPAHDSDQPLLYYFYCLLPPTHEDGRLPLYGMDLFVAHIRFITSLKSYDDNFLCNFRMELPRIRNLLGQAEELEGMEPQLRKVEQEISAYEQRSEEKARPYRFVAQVREADERAHAVKEAELLNRMR